MAYSLTQRSIDRLKGINEILKLIAINGVTDCPIEYQIPGFGGLRTAEEQNGLFTKGVSKCDGFKKKSYHQTGKAFDVYAVVNGSPSWDAVHYEPIARHLQKYAQERHGIKLEWGGDWKWKDMPHFQIS